MQMGTEKSKTFVRITNKEIYNEIKDIQKQITSLMIRTSVNAGVIAVVVSIIAAILSRFI